MIEQEQTLRDFSQLDSNSPFEDFVAYARVISEIRGLPVGVPLPPVERDFDQAADEGWGIRHYAIAHAVGGIGVLQEALGFATAQTVTTWDKERYIQNGKWISHVLGSPDRPKVPLDSDMTAFSRLGLAPAREIIRRVFGSWPAYIDALGFVSRVTYDRWTDQDWIDNGTWLSHMLGSAEEPVMPLAPQLKAAAEARIIPPTRIIRARYGDVDSYRVALGFDSNKSPLDYHSWDKATYLQNGRWLSHAMGSPEHPKMPTTTDFLEGGPLGLCPSISAISRVFGSFPKYQDELGFVSNATLERWTQQDWIDHGLWLSRLLGSAATPRPPQANELNQGHMVGISPSGGEVIDKFGGIGRYHELLGMPTHFTYRDWTQRRVLQHGLTVIEQASAQGRRPQSLDYNTVEGPSADAISWRFGSLSTFHERLGLPDYGSWGADQLVNFGVQWAVQHHDIPPTFKEIEAFHQDGVGPSPRHIWNAFRNMAAYRAAVNCTVRSYHKLAAELADPHFLTEEVARHLLREFRDDDAYAAARRDTAELLRQVCEPDEVNLGLLRATFAESRHTLRWSRDDFVQCGRQAFGGRNLTPEACQRKLAVLNAAGLVPYVQDIADVFGSTQDFIAEVLRTQMPAA